MKVSQNENVLLFVLSRLFHSSNLCNMASVTFPSDVIDFFSQGCFSVSFSGDKFYSVALDEAHEMEINLKTKNALNSFSKFLEAYVKSSLMFLSENS
jgi:hypothetical protein